MPQVYSFNNTPWTRESGGNKKQWNSWDDVNAEFGGDVERVGLSNEDWNADQWGRNAPAPVSKPQTQSPVQPTQSQPQAPAYTTNAPLPPPPPPPPPDFKALAAMAPATMGPTFTPTAAMPAASRGGGEMEDLLTTFARQSMLNPSRWDQQLVKDSVGVIDDSVKRNRSDGQRELAETLSARGLFGGNGSPNSIAWDDGYALEDRLDENERASKNELAIRMAGDHATDRMAAANTALSVADLSRMLDRDTEDDNRFRTSFADNQNRYASEFNRTVGRDFEDDNRARTGFNIQGGSMTEDSAMARAALSLGTQGQMFGQNMATKQFDQNAQQFAESMGLNWAQLSQQDRQYVSDLALRGELGRGSLDLNKQQLTQQKEQFNADFGLRDFLGRSGVKMDEKRFDEGVRQFDEMSAQQKDEFAKQFGLSSQQMSETIRHNKQLERVAMLDYLDRTGSEFTLDDEGRIVKKSGKGPFTNPYI